LNINGLLFKKARADFQRLARKTGFMYSASALKKLLAGPAFTVAWPGNPQDYIQNYAEEAPGGMKPRRH